MLRLQPLLYQVIQEPMDFFRQFLQRSVIDEYSVIIIRRHVIIRAVAERAARALHRRTANQHCPALFAHRLPKTFNLLRLTNMDKQDLLTLR